MMNIAIVLGKEFRKFNGKPVLSMEAKMTAIAAGEIYKFGLVSLLIFTGGRTAGPEHPSEAEAMAAYCVKRYGIPPEAIILEDAAFDTITNARFVKTIILSKGIRELPMLVSRAYHLPRAEGIFFREDLKTIPVYVESMLSLRSSRHCELAEKYMYSLRYRLIKAKEYLLRLQLVIDPEARIQRFITRRMRFAK
jgi:uncharacterized SAM-binding protein YcdF (DUF218 family)